MKIYMHKHLTHEYFYTRKYPDLRYVLCVYMYSMCTYSVCIRDGTIQNLKVSMHCPKISRYDDTLEYLNSVKIVTKQTDFLL